MTELTPHQKKAEEDETIRRTIAGNIKASLLTNIFYLGSRLCIPPIVLAYVSLAEYGLWSYCFVILNYLGMGVFGITNVYVRYIAIYFAHKDYAKINSLLSTGILSITSICVVLLGLLWLAIPWLLNLFHVAPELYHTAFILIIGSTIIFMSDLSIGAFTYVLQSLQLIVAEKMIWMISFTVESLFIIFFLYEGYGIYSLLYAFAIRIGLSIVFSTYVAYQRLPSLQIRFRHFSKEALKLFLHFGGIVQLAGLLGIANRSNKKVLAGAFLGLEATGLYEVGEKFPAMALNLPGSITAVFLPAAAQFHANEQDGKIIQIYLKGSRLINLLTGSMMGFMAAFSIPLIDAWLGKNPTYFVASSILSWFTIGYQMDTLTGPISAIYRAINQPLRELFYGIAQLSLTLTAACLGIYLFGASFDIINITVASMMVAAACAYLYVSNRFLNISHITYFFSVILPGLYPYAIGFVLWWLMKPYFLNLSRIDTLWMFLLSLALYLIVWLPFLFLVVLSKTERAEFITYALKRKTD